MIHARVEWSDFVRSNGLRSLCCSHPRTDINTFSAATFILVAPGKSMDSGSPFQLIDLLRRHDVPFVIIGGHAVTFHGHVRATEDTDIVFLRSPGAEAALLQALTEMNAEWIGDEIDPETRIERTHPVTTAYVRATRLMMLCTDHGFLDVYDFIPGFPETPVEELFASAEAQGPLRYASLEWLRKMKTAANRPKDQADLENLPGDL